MSIVKNFYCPDVGVGELLGFFRVFIEVRVQCYP